MNIKEEMDIQEYINYLESLLPKDSCINKTFFSEFKKEAMFMGGQWYKWGDFESSNLRVLFLKGSLSRLGIFFKDLY